MKAIAIHQFGGRDQLKLLELPSPTPGPNEVRIRIRAAGVNPVDYKIREGLLQSRIPHQFPLILGWDAAGVIDQVGSKVQNFKERDEVYAYCRKPVVQWGAYAEYICLSEEAVALKPRNCSFEEAASFPLALLTAYQVLEDVVHLQKGETILIHAAAGGVGGFAVQIAKSIGAHVLGTASGSKQDYLQRLGVDEPIDYAHADFRKALQESYPNGVDVIFDCVGGEVLEKSLDGVKKGGRIVSILSAPDPEECKKREIQPFYHFVNPSGKQLQTLAKWIEQGKIKTHLEKVFPLEQAATAHELLESRRVQGKVILKIN